MKKQGWSKIPWLRANGIALKGGSLYIIYGELDLIGKASVLKTDGRKPLGVRVSRSPLFLFLVAFFQRIL